MAGSSTPKTILFLGATGGCGLAALRHSLAAGHTCIALCRTPSKLTAKLPADQQGKANLRTEQGNAHDVDAVARCLAHPTRPGALVDAVVFSIGGAFQPAKMTIDDPNVCEKGMQALLDALARPRPGAEAGAAKKKPRVIAISSTGITNLGRDVPVLFIPMYHIMLKDPHKDKKAMEALLIASDADWTLVRPSLLTDGPESDTKVRAGVEDSVSRKVESKAVGYTISREDTGKWIYENLIEETDGRWVRKTATITY